MMPELAFLYASCLMSQSILRRAKLLKFRGCTSDYYWREKPYRSAARVRQEAYLFEALFCSRNFDKQFTLKITKQKKLFDFITCSSVLGIIGSSDKLFIFLKQKKSIREELGWNTSMFT